MLQITQSGSFKMNRKMKDGSIRPNSRRYAYTVSGPATLIAQFKRDIADGTNKGALITEQGTLRYFSWRKCINGEGNLLRSKSGNWYIDTEQIDDLESLSEQSPALMRSLGGALLDRLMPSKPTNETKKSEPEEEPEEEEEDFLGE